MKKKRWASMPWYDTLYFLVLILFFIHRIYANTMFPVLSIKSYISQSVMYMVIVAVCLKVAFSQQYRLGELLIGVILTAVFCMVYVHSNGYFWLVCLPFLIIGAKGIDFDRLLLVHMVCVGGMLLAAFIASQLGYIENLAYTFDADRGVRYAMGTTYPTTFSEFIFFMVLSWGAYRREKITYVELGLFAGMIWVLKTLCDAKTDCLVIGLAVILFAAYRCKALRKIMKCPVVAYMCSIVMPVIAAVNIYVCYRFRWFNDAWLKWDGILGNRLMLGKIGFNTYDGKSLWGQKIAYQTTGRSTAPVEHYYNLDSSYMMILLNFGLICLAVVMLMFFAINLKLIRRKCMLYVFLIALIALESFMENRLIQVQYNIFALLLFARPWQEREVTASESDTGTGA